MLVLLPVSSLYGALFGLFYILLVARVGYVRFKNRIAIGDGNNSALRYVIRGHGNFQEYVPMFLILFGLLELQSVMDTALLHLLGMMCLIGRVFHAYHFCWRGPFFCRNVGIWLTVGALILESWALLAHALSHSKLL